MTQIPNNFFEVPAQFTIPFSNCEINQVFLLAVLADVKPGRMLLDGTVVPTKVTVQQVSFRGVNIWGDLCPNQIEAIEASILDQLDQIDADEEEETSPLTAEDGPFGVGG